LTDNDWKVVMQDVNGDDVELYNLVDDTNETTNVADAQPEVAAKMKEALVVWSQSVDASNEGKDYPEAEITIENPPRRDWVEDESYAPYLEELKERPEYRERILEYLNN